MLELKGNPYSVDQPAEALFYGRQEQLERLVASLTAPIAGSYALIGGRRFGKTSLLLAIERYLWVKFAHPVRESYCVIPVYLNLLSADLTDSGDFYSLAIGTLADKVADHCSDVAIDDWNTSLPADLNQPSHHVFEDRILKLCRIISRKGIPVRVLLLVDKTEKILDRAWTQTLFGHLRWLISDSPRMRNHLKIILAGSSNFYHSVQQRGSPLWNVLRFEYLAAFSEKEVRRLIQEPCDGQLSEAVAGKILACSGGHPYLVQYIMHHLWKENLSDIQIKHVDELSDRFMRKRWDQLDGWRNSIGEEGCRAYSILLSHGGWIEESVIRQAIGGPRPELVPALTALCYHGWAIRDEEWRYRAVGDLVRIWFKEHAVSASVSVANHEQEEHPVDKISILFLSADPTDLSRLRIGEEFREINEELTLSKHRDNFTLALPQLSLKSKNISRALLNVRPQFVHFSGHGTSEGALCFEDENGQECLVSPDVLAALFEEFNDHVNCVLLNACYSEIQARAIAKHIGYVIGTKTPIDDKAAIAFSIGFYRALGAGRTIEEAYRLGCKQIKVSGFPNHPSPVLITGKSVQSRARI